MQTSIEIKDDNQTSASGEAKQRLYAKVYRDLGEEIIGFLQDTDINEVMLNPDGGLWTDSAVHGLQYQSTVSRERAYSIIHGIAGVQNRIVSAHCPQLETELPLYKALRGERFTALVPPVVSAPCFSLRKRASTVFTLEDYVASGRLTMTQKTALSDLIAARKNMLVCGGPGSGKTTVTNALIHEAVRLGANSRMLLLEDVPELQCHAVNTVAMLTSDTVSMRALVRAAMRMRPDRLLIGEVRGAETLDMLKAWNTGCPGGICTVHANGAEEAIQRVGDLAMEAGLSTPPMALMSHTIGAVVSVVRRGHQKGFIHEILTIGGYDNGRFKFNTVA